MLAEKDKSGSVESDGEKRIPVKGDKLTCEACGLSVIIDEVAGSVTFEEPACCGKPMKLNLSSGRKSFFTHKNAGSPGRFLPISGLIAQKQLRAAQPETLDRLSKMLE